MRIALSIILAAALLLLLGCGDGGRPATFEVRGSVSYAGQTVPYGRIDFEPDTARGNHGPGGTAEIRDGRFVTESGQGIVGGPYIVRISGSDGVPVEMGEEGLIDPIGTRLFAEYVEQIEFPHENTTHDFVVPNP